MSIKVYKPQIIIYYKDINGLNTLLTEVQNKEKIKQAINKYKFVEIEGIIIKTDLIQIIKPYKPSDSVQAWIGLQPPEVRNIILEREKEKKERTGKGFQTKKEIINYLTKKGITNFNS